MKTLVPPPITPGPWHLNLYGESPTRGGFDIGPLGFRDGIAHSKFEDDAKFIAAAPAMAEVLTSFLEMEPTCHESYDAEDAPQDGCDCKTCTFTRKVRTALIAAGYTEAADQE